MRCCNEAVGRSGCKLADDDQRRTKDGLSKTATNDASMARLLWRGSLDIGSGTLIHGVAIVAHSFTIASAPQHQYDPDDPFSSSPAGLGPGSSNGNSNNATSNAELCLDLEILRNQPLSFKRRVRMETVESVVAGAAATVPEKKVHGRRALKQSIALLRKGKGKAAGTIHEEDTALDYGYDEEEEQLETVYLPSSSLTSDIQLYIDARCPATLAFFNDTFCRIPIGTSGPRRSRIGLIFTLGDEDPLSGPPSSILVYGQLEDSDSTLDGGRRELKLCIERPRSKKDFAPRPDDPAPRGRCFSYLTFSFAAFDCIGD